MKISRWIVPALFLPVSFCFSSQAMLAPQAQQPSVVEQNRVVSPKDAINGADWLKAEGVQQGLDQLDLGADSKGHPIKFEISKDGAGVQIKLTGSGLDNALASDKTGGGIMGKFKKKNNDAKGASGLTITDLLGTMTGCHQARSALAGRIQYRRVQKAPAIDPNDLVDHPNSPLGNQLYGKRIAAMLGRQDPRRQSVLVVAVMHRNRRLQDDRAGIHLRPDIMDRAAREADARFQGLGVRVQPLE